MFLAYKDMWDMPIDPVDGLEKVKEGESAPKRVGHFVGNIVYAIEITGQLRLYPGRRYDG